jgi:hypothetical protein
LLNPMALFNLNGNCIVQLELHFRDLFWAKINITIPGFIMLPLQLIYEGWKNESYRWWVLKCCKRGWRLCCKISSMYIVRFTPVFKTVAIWEI